MKTNIINDPDSGMVGRLDENLAKPAQVKDEFFPAGAIAFFLSLVALCLIIWFGIYFLMLNRI